MAEDEQDPPAPRRKAATLAAQAEREARLAAALRANLRRRKAQARAREDAAKVGPEAEPEG
ncbi:hypothetical protein [Falsiroseomonas sp. CW058]|uniref:hypothetical protein n=1 Tax=Falsiroseomonas sp. CW058 TaxID=3388664 RepID=UPI003D317D51